MALNFSRRPLFSGRLPEDSLVSPMRIDKVENRCSSQDSVHKDILDLLPSDPFGMDINTTFTAITGWLEDLEVDYGGYGRDQTTNNDGNYQLFAGLNLIWNRCFDDSNLGMGFNIDDILCFGNELIAHKNAYKGESSSSGDLGFGLAPKIGEVSEDLGAPNAALGYALGYLGVRDLMVVEMVCKSLQGTVRGDPLLWRSIHIDQPLNEKITDDVLLGLTSRAQGNLQCLSLVECPRITDDGLRNVLNNNPRLTTLSVPGCTKLSIEGIVTSLKAFKATGSNGVKRLRIGGIYGVTEKHFDDLNLLLGIDSSHSTTHQNSRKPHFYPRGNFYLSCDDNRPIDIEACPRCQNLRLVYDCPAEACQLGERKVSPSEACRACTLCIARCVQCGRCINDSEYEETFCLELLCSDCSDCWKQILKGEEREERKVSRQPVGAGPSCSHRHHG